MNVLSLFDGMSCGQIALNRAGIKYDKYFASEIDKFAIQVTQKNYPDTIQIGSVTEVDVSNLEPINLLIGGSPCQSFSFAGKRNGMTTTCNEEIYTLDRYLELKSDGFQFEGESYLFWEYMRILTDIRKYNPNVLFLLENVEMGNKWERVLSEAIGVFGVHINSALVSAQNRKRIYWTNIRTKEVGLFGEIHSDIPQPEDKGIMLRDVLESEVDEKYYLSDKIINTLSTRSKGYKFNVLPFDGDKKSGCLRKDIAKMGTTDTYIRVGKQGTPKANHSDMDLVCVASRGRESACLTPKRTEYGKQIRKAYEAGGIAEQRKNIQQLEPRVDGKTNTLTSVQKDNLVMQLNLSKESGGKQPYQHNRVYDTDGISPCLGTDARSPAILIPEATSKGYVEIEPGECFDAENINSKTRRGRKMVDKSNCLMAKETDFMRYEYFEPNESTNQTDLVLAGNMRGGKWENTHESSRRVYAPSGKAPTVPTMQGGNQHPKTVSNARIRRLTPVECERLQTVKDNYTSCVSDTQRYKMLGNGWNVETVAHIFSFIEINK